VTRIAWLFLLLLFTVSNRAFGVGGLTPKVQLRLAGGQIMNVGTAGGSALSITNLHFAGSLYVQPKVAFTLGYQLNLDLKAGTLPLHGITASGRYYFLGQGTLRAQDWMSMSSATRSGWSAYGSLEFAQRSYFFARTNGDGTRADISGSSYALNGGLGVDLRLGPNVDINAELNMTGFTFAASDPRYRFGAVFFYFGVGLLL
jgi:hypothetical protein